MGDDPTDNGERYPGAPRWVKLFALGALIVVGVIVTVLAVGTPTGMHAPGGPGHAAPSPAHSR